MNIEDFKNPEVTPNNIFKAIFSRQKELMEKYHHIELASGLLQTEDCPVNIHSKKGQARLKDFSWRITEELMEAKEAFDIGNMVHFEEEIIDALHFITEQHILANISPVDYVKGGDFEVEEFPFPTSENPLESIMLKYYNPRPIIQVGFVNTKFLKIVENLGLAMNCLKNKPWKQTNLLTDEIRFRKYMIRAMLELLELMGGIGLTATDIYNLYFKKSEVNKFRQRSKY